MNSQSDRPVIATVMRVKDEEKYIRYALESLLPLGGPIVLLDDGSTDRTPDIVGDFGNVRYHWQGDLEMDEGRDRTQLLRWALELEPDWIFTLDGDEVLTNAAPERMLRAVSKCPDDVNVFDMIGAVMATRVDSPRPQRYGGAKPLGYWWRPRLVRADAIPSGYKYHSEHNGNLHCRAVPWPDEIENFKKQKLNAWIKYYGYETPQAVEKKRAFYSEHDPANFPRIKQMWRDRNKSGRVRFTDGVNCSSIGITNTVSY